VTKSGSLATTSSGFPNTCLASVETLLLYVGWRVVAKERRHLAIQATDRRLKIRGVGFEPVTELAGGEYVPIRTTLRASTQVQAVRDTLAS
ncbi:MAG: hypothetical protein ACREK6_22550, partial [Candidatus Rokuibacteriota bacterium]